LACFAPAPVLDQSGLRSTRRPKELLCRRVKLRLKAGRYDESLTHSHWRQQLCLAVRPAEPGPEATCRGNHSLGGTSSRVVGPGEALACNLARPFRPPGFAACDDRVAPGLLGKHGWQVYFRIRWISHATSRSRNFDFDEDNARGAEAFRQRSSFGDRYRSSC
jgi:hypothetical protein